MSLHFILGGSGSGKSACVYQHIIRQSMAHPDRKYLVIVPEQSTLQTTREIILQHPAKGILNIDVLSFHRLSHRVFESAGVKVETVLSETGKNLVIRKAASQVRSSLPWLGAKLDRQGYISEVKSLLSELAQYEVTPQMLRALTQGGGDESSQMDTVEQDAAATHAERPGLGAAPGAARPQPQDVFGDGKMRRSTRLLDMKLSDIALLQEAFEAAKRDLFITAEEVPALLARYAPQSPLLAGCTLVFDGFTGFTPVQLTAIRSLMHCASEVYVTVTVGDHENVFGKIREFELFALSKRTIQSLAKMAEKEGVQLAPLTWIRADRGRHAPGSELSRLEKEFLRSGRHAKEESDSQQALCGAKGETPAGDARSGDAHSQTNAREHVTEDAMHTHGSTGQVRILQLPNPASEAAFAASEVLSLIRSEGYAPSAIGIICPDLNEYAPHITRAFERAHIPFFIDRKEPVLMNPCLEFIRAAIEAADKKFSYVSVMRLLRTGMTDISREDTDLLETYLLASGVRSWSGWKKEWVRTVRSLTAQQLEAVNGMRQGFVEKMEGFMKVFSAKENTIHTYTQALMQLLEAFGMEEKLKDETLRPTGLGPSRTARKAAEYDHVYESVRKVMEEADTLLGEGRVCREEYARILEAGFEQAQIGMLPAMIDQIHVGDLLRSRPGNLKALLFLGMNEGKVPALTGSAGLLSAMDRQTLDAYGIRLSPSMKEDIYIQRFYLYLGLTRPSEKLILTWSGADDAGSPMSPSPLLREVRRVLPDIREEVLSDRQMFTLEDAVMRLALKIGQGQVSREDPVLKQVQHGLAKAGVSGPLLHALDGKALTCSDEQITAGSALALYGADMQGSVSRIDIFAQCPFRHFLSYGLRLREREEFTVRVLDTGMLFHDALERFACYMQQDGTPGWRTVSDAQAAQLVRRCVDESELVLFNGLFTDTERNRFAKERVVQILSDSVWGMLRQVRAGDLTPLFFETEFKNNGVNGRIDRIDVCERGDKVYASVVDYKSGSTKFDLGLIYDGRTLQLPVYLGNAMRFLQKKYPGREIVPAGMFYYHLEQPVLKAEAGAFPSPEEIERGMLGAFKPSGIVNLEPEALQTFAQDEQIRNLIIPAPKYNKDGTLHAKSPLAATTGELSGIAGFTGRKMDECRERILQGTIKAQPYREKDKLVCTWCPFRSACTFDMRLPGASCRYKVKEMPSDILRMMNTHTE